MITHSYFRASTVLNFTGFILSIVGIVTSYYIGKFVNGVNESTLGKMAAANNFADTTQLILTFRLFHQRILNLALEIDDNANIMIRDADKFYAINKEFVNSLLQYAALETFNYSGISHEVKSNPKLKRKNNPGIYASFWPKILARDVAKNITI